MNNRQDAAWDHARDHRKHWVEASYANWRGKLSALFPVPDEFLLADAIFSFYAAFEDGKTPQEAYESFDAWAAAS